MRKGEDCRHRHHDEATNPESAPLREHGYVRNCGDPGGLSGHRNPGPQHGLTASPPQPGGLPLPNKRRSPCVPCLLITSSSTLGLTGIRSAQRLVKEHVEIPQQE
jgi:hypothetical protein